MTERAWAHNGVAAALPVFAGFSGFGFETDGSPFITGPRKFRKIPRLAIWQLLCRVGVNVNAIKLRVIVRQITKAAARQTH
jgi:hypothetical protein